MSVQITNKVFAITGAGKGLGRAYALYLAKLGARVVVNNRRHDGEKLSSADQVVTEIRDAGGQAVAEYSSVEDPESGDRLLDTALQAFGSLDCLVANAGVMENRSFRRQTLEQLKQNLDINLNGTLHAVHPVFRHFCEQKKGSIIVTISSAGLFGEFGLPAYSCSKAALIGLMRSLSLEGATKNVTVNAISPYGATQMIDGHVSTEAFARLAPEHVAPVVAWLSDTNVTGEILIAGGGAVSRAKMLASTPIQSVEFGDEDWHNLSSGELSLQFESARKNYEAFFESLDA